MLHRTLVLLVPILAPAVAATAQTQLADLQANAPVGNSNYVGAFTVFAGGTRAVFQGDGAHGTELYVTDGTPAGTSLLVDLVPNDDCNLREMVSLGGEVLFVADAPGLGSELWKTDGTPAGTVLVKDIAPGGNSSMPTGLCRLGNAVYFMAADSNGSALWRSDGTATGTFLVADVNPNTSAFSFGTQLTVAGNRLFFVSDDGTSGDELFVSDGTPAGTALVADLTPGLADTDFDDLAAFGNRLVFAADVQDGHEPWISDGTTAGTFRLADLRPGASGSDPSGWVTVGSRCVFIADSTGSGDEPFVTDGTQAGTFLLADVMPGNSGSNPRELTSFGGYAVFQADGPSGREPYRTNGTTAGTYMIADLAPGANGSDPTGFTQVGNEVWFSAYDPIAGRELFSTDGTAAGTVLLGNFVPAGGLDAILLAPFGAGVLCFSEIDGPSAHEPTFSDGTVAGTFQLADIHRTNTDSDPSGWTALDSGRVVFAAAGDLVGRELFVTDGTPAGTQLLADVITGPTGCAPEWLTARDDDVFFSAEVAGLRHLYVVDTLTGQVAQMTMGSNDLEPRHVVRNGNRVLFTVDASNGRELWRSNGTNAGTGEVFDVMPGPGDGVDADATLVTVGGLTFFAADDGVHGVELWATDGTPAGTYMVVDLEPGSASSNPDELTVFDGMVYFQARSPASGDELWRSDGTAAGTVLAADVTPGTSSSTPRNLEVSGDLLFFTTFTLVGGDQLNVYDGTGTAALCQLPYSFTGYHEMAAAAGGLFFISDDFAGHGTELFFTDGTVGGTGMVRDIGPGAVSGPVEGTLTPMLGGTQVLFAASDLQSGMQLWASDGTAAGTRPVSAFGGQRVGAAQIDDLSASGVLVCLGCDEGVDGVEPWVFDAVDEDLAFAIPYGDGCAAAGQELPTVGAIGSPTLGNGTFAVTVEGAPYVTIAAPAGAGAAAQLPLANGCTVWIAPPPILLGPSLTNAAGRAMTPVPVPNDPLLLGGALYFQWALYTPGGPFLGDFSLTGGLRLQIGR